MECKNHKLAVETPSAGNMYQSSNRFSAGRVGICQLKDITFAAGKQNQIALINNPETTGKGKIISCGQSY